MYISFLRRLLSEKEQWCGEVRSQVIRARDVNFVDDETATKLYNDCITLSRKIAIFIKTTKNSGFSGKKYFDSEN